MPIIPDVRTPAHPTPTSRRLVAGYVGPAAGLRAALLTGVATGARTAGGAR